MYLLFFNIRRGFNSPVMLTMKIVLSGFFLGAFQDMGHFNMLSVLGPESLAMLKLEEIR